MAELAREGGSSTRGPEQVREALLATRLLVLDVDGVLTDGSVNYLGAEELQSFHVRDGQGLVWLQRVGIELAWISGRGALATELRAKELGIRHLYLRCSDKEACLSELQAKLGLTPAVTVAMGDDLVDLGLAARAALFAVPADACAHIRDRAGLITTAPGGRGAVRELCEAILVAQGHWPAILEGRLSAR